ncbi:hypothetical protein, partial [Streptomyces acidiscabies]
MLDDLDRALVHALHLDGRAPSRACVASPAGRAPPGTHSPKLCEQGGPPAALPKRPRGSATRALR